MRMIAPPVLYENLTGEFCASPTCGRIAKFIVTGPRSQKMKLCDGCATHRRQSFRPVQEVLDREAREDKLCAFVEARSRRRQ